MIRELFFKQIRTRHPRLSPDRDGLATGRSGLAAGGWLRGANHVNDHGSFSAQPKITSRDASCRITQSRAGKDAPYRVNVFTVPTFFACTISLYEIIRSAALPSTSPTVPAQPPASTRRHGSGTRRREDVRCGDSEVRDTLIPSTNRREVGAPLM